MATGRTCRWRCRIGPSGWRVARSLRRRCHQPIATRDGDGSGDGLRGRRHRGAAVGLCAGEVDHHDQWRWPSPYRSYAELIGRGGGLATVAQTHRRIWTTVVAAVPEGAAALVVGHGGGIEPGLVACLPDADPSSGVRRSATATVPASLRWRQVRQRPVPPAPVGAAAGVPRRVGGSGRRSVRRSFPQAIPGTTECHQADDVPDLSSKNCTQGDGVDGRGSTSNP